MFMFGVSVGLLIIATEPAPVRNEEIIIILPPPDAEPEPPKNHNGVNEGEVITANLTGYCVCMKCCGKLDGITASGRRIRNGGENPYVVAANWLPLGSIVEIDGQEYTVADRGGNDLSAVGRFDVFIPDGHGAALDFERKHGIEVKIKSIS